MSDLATRKSRLCVTFSETVRERGKHREVTMELTPYCLRVRLKGMRQTFEISPGAIYHRAAAIHAEKMRTEKRAQRRQRNISR